MATVFIATFVVFLAVITGMSIGYIIKRKSIHGSCGGIANLGLEKSVIAQSPATHVKSVWRVKKPGAKCWRSIGLFSFS